MRNQSQVLSRGLLANGFADDHPMRMAIAVAPFCPAPAMIAVRGSFHFDLHKAAARRPTFKCNRSGALLADTDQSPDQGETYALEFMTPIRMDGLVVCKG